MSSGAIPTLALQPHRIFNHTRPGGYVPASKRRRNRLQRVISETEIRVCVNRTCSRSGSRETLQLLTDLAPPGVSVTSCGCLGQCGSGPNLVVLPDERFVRHCGTASRVAGVLAAYCRVPNPEADLKALSLRKQAESAVGCGRFAEAEGLLSEAIDLNPAGGKHHIYKSRCGARLGVGDCSGALEDAREACRIAPRDPMAFVCRGDAYFAVEEYGEAERAYSIALELDPCLRRSKCFKARLVKLQEIRGVVN